METYRHPFAERNEQIAHLFLPQLQIKKKNSMYYIYNPYNTLIYTWLWPGILLHTNVFHIFTDGD